MHSHYAFHHIVLPGIQTHNLCATYNASPIELRQHSSMANPNLANVSLANNKINKSLLLGFLSHWKKQIKFKNQGCLLRLACWPHESDSSGRLVASGLRVIKRANSVWLMRIIVYSCSLFTKQTKALCLWLASSLRVSSVAISSTLHPILFALFCSGFAPLSFESLWTRVDAICYLNFHRCLCITPCCKLSTHCPRQLMDRL